MFNLGHSCQAAFSEAYLFLLAVTSFSFPYPHPLLGLFNWLFVLSGPCTSAFTVRFILYLEQNLVKFRYHHYHYNHWSNQASTEPGGFGGTPHLLVLEPGEESLCSWVSAKGCPGFAPSPALSCHLLLLPYLRKRRVWKRFPGTSYGLSFSGRALTVRPLREAQDQQRPSPWHHVLAQTTQGKWRAGDRGGWLVGA